MTGSQRPRWTSAPPNAPAPPSETVISGTGTKIDLTVSMGYDPLIDTLLNTSSSL